MSRSWAATSTICSAKSPTTTESGRHISKLCLHVVEHTRNEGEHDYNMGLSKRRAQSVVKALTGGFGIAADRLLASGVGSLAPVASNSPEEGRARNRRVELVLR